MTYRTVVESPNARLRRELGLGPISTSRVRCGDWMGFSLGTRVRERDGRHVGRVEAVHWSRVVRIRWDNGWTSEVPLEDVERAGRDE
jgi:hypothetical protein